MTARTRSLHRLESSLDRFQEAHYWIHMLEQHYHQANIFRWHLNVFLKAIKEVPILVAAELQNEKGFKDWFRDQRKRLLADPLIAHFGKQRDFVVHQRMLLPNSSCVVGVTELRGMKLGVGFENDPREDSDVAMDRYLRDARENDVLGLLIPDDESIPCVQRVWKLGGVEGEMVDMCAEAWLRVGKTICAVLEWLQEDVPSLSVDCLHGHQKVQFKLYNRDELRVRMEQLVP